jgi:two-component system, cell cycle sensor histidine kinase and response regulator CckA
MRSPIDAADQRFRLAVEAAPCAMVMVDHEGRIVLVNAHTERLFGYSREELLDQFVEILVPAPPLRKPHSGLRRTSEHEPKARPVDAGRDLFARRKDGSQFPVEIGLNPIETEEDNWLLAILDISERKRAEAQLRESEERFRLAVECAPLAMVIVDHEGKIVLANNHTEKLLGYSREELLGQSVEILVPVSLRKIHSSLRKGFGREPQSRPMAAFRELKVRRKDGSDFPVEIGLNPIQTKDGAWVLASIVDISERKHVEAQLRESEERFRNMADTSPVMIWTAGTDKLCAFFNKGWLEFTGRTLEQELGVGWTESVHPDDVARCLKMYETSFDSRRSFQMEYRLRRKDGEFRWVLETGVPRFGPNGVFAGYVGSCTDITDLKRAQEVTLGRQNLESLGLLARGMAHDFNSLQSVIISRSEVVLENPDLDSSSAEEVREIRKIALHGSEIVHQLMIYVGEDGADLELLDISRSIEDMQELLKLSISKRTCLIAHLDTRLPAILANATHIRQMVMNLVINASEAIGDREGIIDIATSLAKIIRRQPGSGRSLPEGDYVRLVVSDTGCGMSRDVQRKIFDPFFTTKVTGRGLGLAIVQGIVRRYSGFVDVKSSPNAGTRFEILLPYARRAVMKKTKG